MGVVGKIIGLVIAVYVTALTVPTALAYLTDAGNWTGVTGAVLTLGSVVLPIVVIASLILMYLHRVG